MERILKWSGLFSKLAAYRKPTGWDWTGQFADPTVWEQEEDKPTEGLKPEQFMDPSYRLDPSTYQVKAPELEDYPFTKVIQLPEYRGDTETMIANEGEEILDEPSVEQWSEDIAKLLAGYKQFHLIPEEGLREQAGLHLMEMGKELMSKLPEPASQVKGPGRVIEWIKGLMLNVSQNMPESRESREEQVRRQKIEFQHQMGAPVQPSGQMLGEGKFQGDLRKKERRREALLDQLIRYDNPLEQTELIDRLKTFTWGKDKSPAAIGIDPDEAILGIIERYKARQEALDLLIRIDTELRADPRSKPNDLFETYPELIKQLGVSAVPGKYEKVVRQIIERHRAKREREAAGEKVARRFYAMLKLAKG